MGDELQRGEVMTDYIVRGARKTDGETVEVRVSAASAEAASEQVNAGGIMVEKVRVSQAKPKTKPKPTLWRALGTEIPLGISGLEATKLLLDIWLAFAILILGIAALIALDGESGDAQFRVLVWANLMIALFWLPLIIRIIVGFRIEWRRFHTGQSAS
jgi:hypothetical protein